MERWIGIARAAKDGYVAAIDQGFAIWERRIRQTIAPAQASKAPASQIESWLEEWRAHSSSSSRFATADWAKRRSSRPENCARPSTTVSKTWRSCGSHRAKPARDELKPVGLLFDGEVDDIYDFPTPALLADADALEHNLKTMAAALPGPRLRPHVKAHKCTALAKMQARAGHKNFTCATIREIEGMAAAGLSDDLLLANEVLDAHRLAAVKARVTVAVDSIPPLSLPRRPA